MNAQRTSVMPLVQSVRVDRCGYSYIDGFGLYGYIASGWRFLLQDPCLPVSPFSFNFLYFVIRSLVPSIVLCGAVLFLAAKSKNNRLFSSLHFLFQGAS
jgi:hypothetical protein